MLAVSDPNLFHLDWERTFEVLATIVVLAFVLERGLALLFEHRWYVKNWKGKGAKEFIAFFAAAVICWRWDFDALSMIILTQEETTKFGTVLTAAVIAGGSKGAVKLFHDVLDWKSSALRKATEENPNDEN